MVSKIAESSVVLYVRVDFKPGKKPSEFDPQVAFGNHFPTPPSKKVFVSILIR